MEVDWIFISLHLFEMDVDMDKVSFFGLGTKDDGVWCGNIDPFLLLRFLYWLLLHHREENENWECRGFFFWSGGKKGGVFLK